MACQRSSNVWNIRDENQSAMDGLSRCNIKMFLSDYIGRQIDRGWIKQRGTKVGCTVEKQNNGVPEKFKCVEYSRREPFCNGWFQSLQQ